MVLFLWYYRFNAQQDSCMAHPGMVHKYNICLPNSAHAVAGIIQRQNVAQQ